jgi:protein-S-isoprenylcysteine O-methyltransferase Ste14
MRVSLRGLSSVAGNCLLAAFFAAFTSAHLRAFLALGRPSALLMVAKESLDVLFYLTRPSARSFSRSPYAWLAGLGGTFTPLLLRPTAGPSDSPVGQLVLCAGLALQFAGMLSLNRSIGIVPAHRGIKTGGLYRLVRHPLYLAYAITHAGYLISNPSLHNAEVALATFLFQLLRIANEERFLRRDPAYEAFARTTRWALVPGIY